MKELETLNKQNFEDLIKGKKSFLSSLDTLPKAIFSGSFNPLHQGHKTMHDHARKVLNTDIFFEVCLFPCPLQSEHGFVISSPLPAH